MAWKAKLVDLRDVGNGTADVQVTYYDGTKEFTRSYNLHPESFPTRDAFRSFIQQEKAKLAQFDSVVTVLQDLVSKDIT